MDPLEHAIRRYREIAPDPKGVSRYRSEALRNLRVWLERDVCQAVGPYLRRIKFQKEAAWSLHYLTQGTTSPERQAVQEVDAAMVASAKILLQAINRPTIQKQLRLLNPPRETIVRETVTIGDATPRLRERETAVIDHLTHEIARIQQIADRFWKDLVYPGDFFVPRGGWHGSLQHNHSGKFLASLFPEFQPIGDMISVCMMQRIDQFQSELRAFQVKCIQALRQKKQTMTSRLQKCVHALERVDAGIHHLKALVVINPYSTRSACMGLTQLYLMLNPNADVTWLGLDHRTLAEGPPSLFSHLTNQRNVEFYDLIAVALKQLRKLYKDEPKHRSEVEEAVADGGLVIDEKSGLVYWENNQVKCDWSKNRLPLRLLTLLAMVTPLQMSIEDTDVYDLRERPESSSAFPQLKNRLARLLPPSLRILIVIGAKKASYRLDLPKGRAHVFPTTSKN